MLITAAIIQRFSLPGKTGGYDHSESGSPGALQEHRVGGGHECVERWRKQEPYPVSSSLVRPQDITARDQAVPDGLSVCGYRCQKCCLRGLLAQ